MSTSLCKSTSKAFLSSICHDWLDDLPKLIYADWLDEQDDKKASSIRVLCDPNLITPNKSKIVANQFVINKYDWQKPLNEIIIKYRKLGVKQRPDWHSVKVKMMMKVLRLKFEADEHCKKVLLSTVNKKHEASPRDYFWAEGKDGTGQNKLGELLMQLRDEIVESDHSEVFS